MPEENPTPLNSEGLPDWEPVSFYDAPGVVLKQIMDGEGALGRAVRTFMDSPSLSPKERDSFATQVKKDHGGGNPVVNTAIDIALNPMVWFLLLTGGVGAKQFAASKGKFMGGRTDVKGKYAGMVVDLFRGVGMLGMATGAKHAVTDPFVTKSGAMHDGVSQVVREIVGNRRAKFQEHTGLVDLEASRNGLQKEKAELISGYVTAEKNGHWEGTVPNIEIHSNKTRVALIEKADGTTSHEMLPALRGDAAERQYKNGADIQWQDKSGAWETVTIKSEPVVVTNEESYALAKDLLGTTHVPWITHTDVGAGKIENILPVNRDSARALLEGHGIDLKILDDHILAEREVEHYLLNQNLGMTPDGIQTRIRLDQKIQLDPTKIETIVNERMKRLGLSDGAPTAKERESSRITMGSLTDELLPEFIVKMVREGRTNVTHVKNELKKAYEAQINNPNYYTNVQSVQWKLDNGKGVRVEPYDVMRNASYKPDAQNASEIIPQVMLRRSVQQTKRYDPEALKTFYRHFGSAMTDVQKQEMEMKIMESNKQLQESISTGTRTTSFIPMEPDVNHRIYVDNMIGHNVLYVQKPSPELLKGLQDAHKVHSNAPISRADDRTTINLDPDDKIRSRTYNMLGMTPEDVAAHRMGNVTYPLELKSHPAIIKVQKDLRANKALMERTTDETLRNKYANKIRRLEKEERFISSFRQSATQQSPKNMYEFLNALASVENQATSEQLLGWFVPRLLGKANARDVALMQGLQKTREAAKWFRDGSIGKWVGRNLSKPGRDLYEMAARHAERPVYFQDAPDMRRSAAGYLYSTHLSSFMQAMYNSMQPFTWAAGELGLGRVLKAYPKSVKQWLAYNSERLSMGMRQLDPHTKDTLLRKHFPQTNYEGTGIDTTGLLGGDFASTKESSVVTSRMWRKPSMWGEILVNWALTPFTKFEELNRIVVSNLGHDLYKEMGAATGIYHSAEQRASEIAAMQGHFNFTGSLGSKPRILSDPDWGAGKVMSGPLLSQFFSYPLRFISNVATSAQVFGGKKSFGFQNLGGPELFEMNSQVAATGRMLGISALVYEIGKNMLGTDISPGLSAQSVSGAGRFLTGDFMPPVLDIPLKIMKSLNEGDQTEFRRQMYRVLPYGNPLAKAMGAMPAIPGGGPFGLLQSQYADWSNPDANGNIPVYKDDGTLQSVDSPLRLVMKGIGFDSKKFASPQDASKFLIANRQEISGLKRQYKDAILGNNFAGAAAIEGEYKKRFGVPMTVKNAEWDQAIKLREVGVAERLVDTLPSDVRNQYQQSLGGPLNNSLGLDTGGLESADTAKQRSALGFRGFSSGLSRPEIPVDNIGG